ncbi:DNA-directed RNA polymerase subunit omega [Acidipila sp. EB88]|uniref:DNA-directed RNA polymerase subunit omega n=1 Tax=Acidipila sp. EB88 TaxID=2305226 RepID=UPI000F5E1C61|nr:DNA-directed RNA polymerase subunit omega [Acidipila sp. EB88]RRA50202.1 DNA-directed RNA polymerase subunit omega [Acidipila sp. EB88]
MKLEQDFDSNFRYVIVAARRARQLQNGSTPLLLSPSSKASKIAQHEIKAGLVAHVRHETPVIKPGFDAPEIPRFV